MRRMSAVAVLGALLLLLTGTMVAVASPREDHDQPFPEHPHVLVLGVQVDENDEPVSVKKCVDLASNQALPLNAHHVHVHFGRAGEALASNGNFVVPVAPFPGVPWSDCETLLDFFGF